MSDTNALRALNNGLSSEANWKGNPRTAPRSDGDPAGVEWYHGPGSRAWEERERQAARGPSIERDPAHVARGADRFLALIALRDNALAVALAEDFRDLVEAVFRNEVPPSPRVAFTPAKPEKRK